MDKHKGKRVAGLEDETKAKITSIHLEQHYKKYKIGKRQAMMVYMDTGFKIFTTIHDRRAIEMNRCLQEADIPEWMTKGKIILIQEDPPKENAPSPNNYRPTTCLPIMWKILTAEKREEIYYSANKPRTETGCCKGTEATG